MNAFWMVLAYAGLAVGGWVVGWYLTQVFCAKFGKSRNDHEVERLKATSKPIYPWHLAPHWAVCAATDVVGMSYWYASDPVVSADAGAWFGDGQRIESFPPPSHINWKDSKEMRP